MLYSMPQWLIQMDWDTAIYLIAGSGLSLKLRDHQLREKVKRTEAKLKVHEELAKVKAGSRRIERQTTRRGVFSPILTKEQRAAVIKVVGPEKSAQADPEHQVYPKQTKNFDEAIRTISSGKIAIPHPRNSFPQNVPPANDSIVAYRKPSPPFGPPLRVEENQDLCETGECSVCTSTWKVNEGYLSDQSLLRRRDATELEYPTMAEVAGAKANDSPGANACEDTIRHVLKNDDAQMTGFGRFRHCKDIPIQELERLISKELRAPGVMNFFGTHRVFNVDDHPLVVEHRERVEAAGRDDEELDSGDSSIVYALKVGDQRCREQPAYETLYNVTMQPDGCVLHEGFQTRTGSMESVVSEGFVSANFERVPQDQVQADSGVGSTFDRAAITTASKTNATSTGFAPANPQRSRVARRVMRANQARALQASKLPERRSRSAGTSNAQLTRIDSQDPENHVRWAEKLQRVISIVHDGNSEDAITSDENAVASDEEAVSSDEETCEESDEEMEILHRVPRRAYAPPDKRISDTSAAASSATAVTRFQDTPQVDKAPRSTPPTSVSHEAFARRNMGKGKARIGIKIKPDEVVKDEEPVNSGAQDVIIPISNGRAPMLRTATVKPTTVDEFVTLSPAWRGPAPIARANTRALPNIGSLLAPKRPVHEPLVSDQVAKPAPALSHDGPKTTAEVQAPSDIAPLLSPQRTVPSSLVFNRIMEPASPLPDGVAPDNPDDIKDKMPLGDVFKLAAWKHVSQPALPEIPEEGNNTDVNLQEKPTFESLAQGHDTDSRVTKPEHTHRSNRRGGCQGLANAQLVV